jgi:hypothetical protein
VSISLVIQRRTFRKERDSRGRDHILIGFADGRRLYLGTPVSSTNITDLHNPNPNRSLTIIFVYVVDVTSVNISPFDCDDNVFSSTCEELDRDAKAMFGTSICDNEELKSKCCICRNYGK